MLFRLTNGITTLVLSSGTGILGVDYFPTSSPDDLVTEEASLVLEGSASTIRGIVTSVEQMFMAAQLKNERVYVEFRPVDSGDILRSQIGKGLVLWPKDPIQRNLLATTNLVQLTLVFERVSFWEGPEEEMYLSSSTQTERTGGVNITTAAGSNWVGLAAARVRGTKPAPIRFRVTNNSGGSLDWRRFYLGNNTFSTPGSADLWLLANETTVGNGARSWSANTNHNLLNWIVPLNTTLLGQTQGRSFHVIASFSPGLGLSSTYLRASIGSYISTVYLAHALGQERKFDIELIDLGELPLPPGGLYSGNSGAAIVITVRCGAVGGSATLDYIMLMPTDSYRQWTQMGFLTANGEGIEDNGIDGGIYMFSGSAKSPIIVAPGQPLRVIPNRDQRLYLIFDEEGNFVNTRAVIIQAWYRPRYDSI